MTLPELMSKGWKGELPSDTLLRENPAAYDSSPQNPFAQVLYFVECATPPPFKFMLPEARGYVSTCGRTVLYGDRNAKPAQYRDWLDGKRCIAKADAIKAPNPIPPSKVHSHVKIQGMNLPIGTCSICTHETGITRHHLTPKQVRHLSPNDGRKTVKICWPCHLVVHRRWTNKELLNIQWEDVVEIVLELRKPAVLNQP